MKQNQPPGKDESLNGVLRQWSVEAPLPPRFQQQVWQRISRAESQPKATFWTDLARLLEVVLPRPKVAFAYVASLLILGGAAGAVAAQIKTNHLEADLSARYVQSVSPFQAGASQP